MSDLGRSFKLLRVLDIDAIKGDHSDFPAAAVEHGSYLENIRVHISAPDE